MKSKVDHNLFPPCRLTEIWAPNFDFLDSIDWRVVFQEIGFVTAGSVRSGCLFCGVMLKPSVGYESVGHGGLLHIKAAVYVDLLTCNVISIADQECNCLCDLLRTGKSL
jgi:hypothetical protein